MSGHSFQFSHAELVALLSLLRLPAPPALGHQPNLGLREPALAITLAAAATGLRARGLLAANGSPQPDLAEMLTLAAGGEQQLIFVGRQGPLRLLCALACDAHGRAVFHTVTPERHCFESVDGPAHLLDLIALTAGNGSGPQLSLPPNVLTHTVEALENNQPHTARNILAQAAINSELITDLLIHLGPQPGRFSLLAINLRAEPQVRAAAIIHGTHTSWWAEPDPNRPECFLLRPADSHELRRSAAALYNACA